MDAGAGEVSDAGGAEDVSDAGGEEVGLSRSEMSSLAVVIVSGAWSMCAVVDLSGSPSHVVRCK